MADRIVSTGEDGYFRVWELGEINGKLKVKHFLTKKNLNLILKKKSKLFLQNQRSQIVIQKECPTHKYAQLIFLKVVIK